MVDFTSSIINQALKDENNLQVAFETWQAFNSQKIYIQIRKTFVEKLLLRFKKELSEKYQFLNGSKENDGSKEKNINFYFEFKPDNWKNHFKIGLFDYDNDRLFFSIQCINQGKGLCDKIYTQIKTLMGGEGNINNYRWWVWAKEPYNKWDSNFEGLRQFAFCEEMALKYFSDRMCSFVDLIDKELKNYS